MTRVAHVITTLDVGGAEKLLAGVVRHTPGVALVVSIAPLGPVAAELEAMGIEVAGLDVSGWHDLPRAARQLTRLLAESRPDVVQTWMYHADLLGGWAARRAGIEALAWSLHASDLPRGEVATRTLRLRRVAARLSHHWPDAIVCTSTATLELHRDLGYDVTKLRLIRNGFEAAPVRSTPDELRQELGIPGSAVVVMRAGRLDPQKDWYGFSQALTQVLDRHADVHVLGCGRGVGPDAPALRALVSPAWRDRVHLIGLRDDIAALHAVADIAVSSSAFGETFPLVIGEAMAAGVPVVTTDVGDSSELVGPTGIVVPPRDPAALASAVEELVRDPARRRDLGARAQARVRDRYAIERTAEAYAALHAELAARSSAGH
jgi:glycosyltransferase involved in cell wall biosynthesis